MRFSDARTRRMHGMRGCKWLAGPPRRGSTRLTVHAADAVSGPAADDTRANGPKFPLPPMRAGVLAAFFCRSSTACRLRTQRFHATRSRSVEVVTRSQARISIGELTGTHAAMTSGTWLPWAQCRKPAHEAGRGTWQIESDAVIVSASWPRCCRLAWRGWLGDNCWVDIDQLETSRRDIAREMLHDRC